LRSPAPAGPRFRPICADENKNKKNKKPSQRPESRRRSAAPPGRPGPPAWARLVRPPPRSRPRSCRAASGCSALVELLQLGPETRTSCRHRQHATQARGRWRPGAWGAPLAGPPSADRFSWVFSIRPGLRRGGVPSGHGHQGLPRPRRLQNRPRTRCRNGPPGRGPTCAARTANRSTPREGRSVHRRWPAHAGVSASSWGDHAGSRRV